MPLRTSVGVYTAELIVNKKLINYYYKEQQPQSEEIIDAGANNKYISAASIYKSPIYLASHLIIVTVTKQLPFADSGHFAENGYHAHIWRR